MNTLKLFCFLFATFGVVIGEDEVLTPCFLPTGSATFCVPLPRCRHVKELVSNLQRPLPGDVSLLVKDSFFCPTKNAAGEATVCCPLDGIQEPAVTEGPAVEDFGSCTLQSGEDASCVIYNRCSPFLQMLSNMKQPFPPEIPELMRNSWLCDVKNVGGFSLPAICCPTAGVVELTSQQKFESHPNRAALAPSDTCGLNKALIRTRIVGGQEAELGAYPWLANLGFQLGGKGKVEFKCGGSLIGPRYVMTAAHCVTNLPGSFQLTTVRVGEHRLSTNPDCVPDKSSCADPPQDIKISKIIFHPKYNTPNPFRNDIALLKLSQPVVENAYVIPVCLPFADEENEEYQKSKIGDVQAIHVAGWGATNEKGKDPADALQFLNVSVFIGDKCKAVYEERQGFINPKTQLCSGGEKGRDSCVGDSGSALMMEDQSETGDAFWKQIGIVSFGPRLCGTEGVPGVYTKVRSYLDWILDTVEVE